MATHPNRKSVTIRCDRDVYAAAREVMEWVPNTSLSDVIEGFLAQFVNTFRPYVTELRMAKSEAEALAILDRFVAASLGQATLQFARDSAPHRVEKGGDE